MVKGAQINVVAKKIVTQRWSEIMLMKYKQVTYCISFIPSCYYDIMLLIWSKSWNYVYWLLLLLTRIRFGHAQISAITTSAVAYKSQEYNALH